MLWEQVLSRTVWAFGKLDVAIPRLLPQAVLIACAPNSQRHQPHSHVPVGGSRQLLGQPRPPQGSSTADIIQQPGGTSTSGQPRPPQGSGTADVIQQPSSTAAPGPPQAKPASGGTGQVITSQGRWNLRDLVDLYWTCGRLSTVSVDVGPLTERVLEVLSSGECPFGGFQAAAQDQAQTCLALIAVRWHVCYLLPTHQHLQDRASCAARTDLVPCPLVTVHALSQPVILQDRLARAAPDLQVWTLEGSTI